MLSTLWFCCRVPRSPISLRSLRNDVNLSFVRTSATAKEKNATYPRPYLLRSTIPSVFNSWRICLSVIFIFQQRRICGPIRSNGAEPKKFRIEPLGLDHKPHTKRLVLVGPRWHPKLQRMTIMRKACKCVQVQRESLIEIAKSHLGRRCQCAAQGTMFTRRRLVILGRPILDTILEDGWTIRITDQSGKPFEYYNNRLGMISTIPGTDHRHINHRGDSLYWAWLSFLQSGLRCVLITV